MSDFQVPTHEIVTPKGNHKVVLKDFISGYDDEAIEAIYTRGKHKIKPADPSKPGEVPAQDMELDGANIQEAEREGVRRVVISVDGSDGNGKPDGIVSLVYSMHKDDARYVKKMVDLVINPTEETPEKKGSAAKPTKNS
jgi:hypothetical protein